MSDIVTSDVSVRINAGLGSFRGADPFVKIKVLRPNIVDGVNTLTQDMIDSEGSNTIFVVRSCFRLDGRIVMPENCGFEFAGGQLSGGTLVGSQTKMINLYDYQILNGTERQGTFKNITAIKEL